MSSPPSGQDAHEELRRKPLAVLRKHSAQRVLDRTSMEKVIEAIESGDIVQEGRRRYRATLPVGGGMLLVVLF